MINNQHKFTRVEKLIGEENLLLLKEKTILIVGIGGVGGACLESLVRTGVGHVIIIDKDIVDVTNINRQVIALTTTIGQKKVDVFKDRIKEINPDCKVEALEMFLTKDNIDLIDNYEIDYLIDACDTIETKKAIMKKCLDKKIPFITSLGTGNKFDPSLLEITDIRKTKNDPIARILRKYIKDNKINKKITVLASSELPKKQNDRVVSSMAFVPNSAGLLIASYIIRKFICK